MNYNQNFVTKDDEDLAHTLAPLGLVLCGGYCRDMLLNRAPADMDFILLTHPGKSQQSTLEDVFPEFIKVCERLGANVLQNMVQYSGAGMACMAKAEYKGREFQLLLPRNTGAEHPWEAVEQFQWNFNHAYYTPPTFLGIIGGGHEWVPGVQHEVFQKKAIWKCASEIPEARQKYREYFPDWDFSLYE